MMNPFFQIPPEKPGRNRTAMDDEMAAHQYAQTSKGSAPRKNIGLWVGKLLIRMGKKLAEQDVEMITSKERA
jgi:hypothetical protein